MMKQWEDKPLYSTYIGVNEKKKIIVLMWHRSQINATERIFQMPRKIHADNTSEIEAALISAQVAGSTRT